MSLPPASESSSQAPLNMQVLGDLAPMRAALGQAGYSADVMAGTLGIQQLAEGIDLPMLLRRTQDPTPYYVLLRLFFLGQSVPEPLLRPALAPMPLDSLVNGGVLAMDGSGLHSTIKIVPHEDFYFASDFFYPARLEPMAPNHVLGVGPASKTLAVLTPRIPATTALDVGCGAGVQAIMAARHARQVTGTDINSRALNLACFNARLNGISNVSWKQGSFFEPVAEETFDLVVSNPPFVISPQSDLMYRDSGMRGDGVSEFVVQGCARKLNEGGFAAMLINWHHQGEEDWEQRPRQWVAGCGCDCWIIRSGISAPLAYAASWLRFNESRHPERYGQLLDEWLHYYQKLGIERISAGAVVMRKRSGSANWVRCDCADDVQGSGPCTPSILRVFAAEDLLRRVSSDAQLLELCLAVHPDLIATQQLALHEGKWASESIALSMREGFPFAGKADIHILQLLLNCDGKRPLRPMIQSLADYLDTSFDALVPSCLDVIKKMLRSGMLVNSEETFRVDRDGSLVPNSSKNKSTPEAP